MRLRNWTLGMAAALSFVPAHADQAASSLASFCDRLPRPAYAELDKLPQSNDWFEVYEITSGVFAIYEPFQWQEVISYLIVGTERALLFDTGNGIGDIASVITAITDRPIVVLNSHSHYDHIGGNAQFDDVRSVRTDFSIVRSAGVDNTGVALEVSGAALCKGLPAGVTAESHHIKPFAIAAQVVDGEVFDLGGRALEVMRTPGHTDDSIVLIDRDAGLLWTGDSFYAGPIWLYAPETDFAAYRASLAAMAALVPDLKALLPAHNTPWVAPSQLTEALQAFDRVMAGEVAATPAWEGTVTYDFEGFGFLIREDTVPVTP
ncbi:MAG: MBL fold metallo-hydrolase [Pseudomonadota bacterium]